MSQLSRNRVHRGLGAGLGHTGFQASNHEIAEVPAFVERVVARLDLRQHRHGHPDVGRVEDLCPREACRCDAEDGVVAAVQLDRFAGHIGIAAKAPLPAAVTDDGDGMAILIAIVLLVEDAPPHSTNSEHVEVIPAHHVAPDERIVPTAAAEADLCGAVCDETREHVVAVPHVPVIGKGQHRKLGFGEAGVESNQL